MTEENKEKEFDPEKLKKILESADFFDGENPLNKFLPKDFDVEKIKKAFVAEKRINNYGELMNWAVREKYKLLSSISALSATLLIVATFNENLIELNSFVRILLVSLLLLIPISVWALIYELYKAETHGFDQIKLIMSDIGDPDVVKKFDKFKRITLRGLIPWIIGGIFSVIIMIIAVLILEKL